MTIELPAVVAAYFNAENAHDADGVAACFGADGEVRDERERHQGPDAIRAWKQASSARYAATVALLDCTPTAHGCVVEGEVSGNFPGSPLDLRYTFILERGKIASLEVVP